jgi:hypothetical protein
MTSGLVPVSVADPIADEHLGTWASTFLQIASVSAQLARTPFVPASLRVTGERGVYDEGATAANVAAAILTGQEIGMEPMAALRSINVINATPALSALALRALAQKQGHHVWLVEATKTRAIVEGLRAGEDDSKVQRITWTIDDARDRNLAGRPNWRTQPRNMLIARATSEVVRLVAADAVLGIPYSIEELEDGDEAPPGADAPPPPDPAPRTARRRGARAAAVPAVESAPAPAEPASAPVPAPPEDEPPLDDGIGPHVDEPAGGHMLGALEPERVPITDAQRKALHAGFRDLGIERPERLRIVTGVVGRPVTSANELDEGEAGKVLDVIALEKAQRAGGEINDEDAARLEGKPAEDEPPLDDALPGSGPATGADFVAIREAFDAAQFASGREGQDVRVRYASGIVGRQLADPRDLTHGEAEEVTAALRLMAEGMPPPDDGEAGV